MEFTILPLLCGQRMAKPKSSGSFPTKIIAIEWVDNQNICRLPKTQCTFSWEKSVPNACRYQENAYLCNRNRETTVANAEIAQLVEHNLAKVRVASSSLVFRSTRTSVICSSPFFFNGRFLISQCPGGGIGRRARFRCVCREACRFESCSGHKGENSSKL